MLKQVTGLVYYAHKHFITISHFADTRMKHEERKEVESQIKELQKAVDMSLALNKLEALPEFSTVFLEGLFKEEAIKTLMDKSSPEAISEPSLRKLLDEKLDMIHSLSAHFGTVHYRGSQAKENINKLSEYLVGE